MKKKILILEDHDGTAEMLSYVMDHLGYDVIISASIMHVSDILKIRPRLIILDHKLSDGLGGILCHRLKVTHATKNIPILMVSASTNIVEIAEQCGADEYISKPFDIEELEFKMAKLISNQK